MIYLYHNLSYPQGFLPSHFFLHYSHRDPSYQFLNSSGLKFATNEVPLNSNQVWYWIAGYKYPCAKRQECARCVAYLVNLKSVWRQQPLTAVLAKAKADIMRKMFTHSHCPCATNLAIKMPLIWKIDKSVVK